MSDDTTTEEPAQAPDASAATAEQTSAAQASAVHRIFTVWVPAPARRRLLDVEGVELVDDPDQAADLVLASTRTPPGRRNAVREMASADAPLLVLCHPGGEAVAVEFVRSGAVSVIAEGNEAAAVGYLQGVTSDHLVTGYARRLDAGSPGGAVTRITDDATGLAGASAFEVRLAELDRDGVMPRLGLVDFGSAAVSRHLSTTSLGALRRRMGVAMENLASYSNAELYDLGDPGFALIGPDLGLESARILAQAIVAVGRAFSPAGEPLPVAVGLAGPETAADTTMLRQLAERALESARHAGDRVADAQDLSDDQAAAVELASAFQVAAAVDGRDPQGDHGPRIADLAMEVGRRYGVPADDLVQLGLAGQLHDIGKAADLDAAFDSGDENHDTVTRLHPERGADYVRLLAGETVAGMIRSHHERWDGTGFPDGLEGADIPLGARILAVVDTYDRLSADGAAPTEAAERLRSEAGGSLDPDLVEIAVDLLGIAADAA